jgi:hypothetical protein
MADRAATIHWQIAQRILWHVAAGNTNEEAVRKTAEENRGVTLTPEDTTKIAKAIDQQSAQFQPSGYWYALVWDGFISNLQRGIPRTEAGFKMPTWGWGLLIGGVVVALLWKR